MQLEPVVHWSTTSWIAKRKRNALLANVTKRQDSAPLLNMSWQQFESLVAAYFEQQGYRVVLYSTHERTPHKRQVWALLQESTSSRFA